MRINDLFTYLNERWNGNQSDGSQLTLRMITKVSTLIGEVEIKILFLKLIILPLLKF